MDTAVAKALQRQEDLRKELDEISQFLAMYERLSGTKIEQDNSGTEFTLSPRRDASPRQIADIVERLLREANRPIQRGELAALLEARGVAIPGTDKPRYLGTILWRNKERFPNIPGEGYFLPDLMSEDQKERSSHPAALSAEELRLYARNFVDGLDRSSREHALAAAPSGLPSDLDARLLVTVRDAIERELSDIERRSLRGLVLNILRDQTS